MTHSRELGDGPVTSDVVVHREKSASGQRISKPGEQSAPCVIDSQAFQAKQFNEDDLHQPRDNEVPPEPALSRLRFVEFQQGLHTPR